MALTYQVIPFRGQAKDAANPAATAQQLAQMINAAVADGWEFVEVANITIDVSPGCLGSLLGAKAGSVTHEQVVFRRER